MKTYILASLLIATLLILQASAQTCGDHPLLSRISDFADNNKKFFKKAGGKDFYEDILSEIADFATREPSIVTGLDQCEGYEGVSSCCTNSFVDIIPEVLRGYFGNKADKKPLVIRFKNRLAKNLGECGGK